MSPPTEIQRVLHILDAIRTIERRVASIDETRFSEDEVRKDFVLYQLAVLGEAANRLSERLRARHPDIPLRQIVAFRNRILHEYHSVSDRLVWQTIIQNLPDLKAAMEAELAASRAE